MTVSRTILSLAFFWTIALALAAPRVSRAADPDLVYRTISTEHFRIHFHQGLEDLARELADTAEAVHAELSVLYGWEIIGPTEVVLTDSTDDANGSATAMPRPLIRLFASPPTADSSLSNHDDWMRTLFTHEYSHAIQLQMHGGAARVVNAVFGDVYLPNQMAPTWLIEGMAVMEETYRTTAGRIRASQFRASLRMNALEGKLLSLGEVSNATRQYPRGNIPYLYGAFFIDYVRSRFGEAKLYEIVRDYGSNTLPYGLNRTFKRVLGVELATLYDDWLESVRKEAFATKAAIEKEGLTSCVRLTDDGESKGQPLFTRDGESVLLSIADGETRAAIFALPAGAPGPRKALALSGGNAHLSLTRRGDLFYTRTAPFKKVYRFDDVFALEAKASSPRRVTYGARSREAAVSPSGREIAMVVVENGKTRLVLADERGIPARTLIELSRGDQVFSPAWSPSGREIAVVVRRGGSQRLEIVDPLDAEIVAVFDEAGLEIDPVFDPTGRYLVFASDKTGIYDIYALEIESGALRRLTNVVGGANSPAVSWDGSKLAYLDISSKGSDLFVTDFAPKSAEAIARVAAPAPDEKQKPIPTRVSIGPYNPLPSLVPRSWTLGAHFGADSSTVLEAVTSMNDAVGHHAVGAAVSYGLDARTMSVSGGYSYYGMVPSLHLGVSHRTVPREDGYLVGGIARGWDQRITNASVGLGVSVPGNDSGHSLSLSYGIMHAAPKQDVDIEIDPNGPLPQIPLQYFRAGIDFGWSYSDTVGSPFGISAEKGRVIWASVGVDHPALGSDLSIISFGYGWQEFVEAPWIDHHVFALRLSGSVYVSDPPQQSATYIGGYSEQNVVDALWNNTPMGLPPLRGYPPNAFAGDQAHLGHLEYRFPIWWFEAAYKTTPLFLRELHAAVFTDHAIVTFDSIDRDDWRASVGAELVWSLRFGYYMPINVRLGYARGLMEGGINEVIAVIGNSF